MAPPLAPALPRRRLHVLARRWLNPLVVRAGVAGARWSPIALVLHVGRRTRRRYATPLLVHRWGAHLVVPLTYGPAARWCLNVLAAGRCVVRLGGREVAAAEPSVIGLPDLPPRARRLYRRIGITAFLRLTVEGAIPTPPDAAASGRTGPVADALRDRTQLGGTDTLPASIAATYAR